MQPGSNKAVSAQSTRRIDLVLLRAHYRVRQRAAEGHFDGTGETVARLGDDQFCLSHVADVLMGVLPFASQDEHDDVGVVSHPWESVVDLNGKDPAHYQYGRAYRLKQAKQLY